MVSRDVDGLLEDTAALSDVLDDLLTAADTRSVDLVPVARAARAAAAGPMGGAGALRAGFAVAQSHPTPDPSGVARSARNRFVGIVTDVVSDTVMSQVEMLCGGQRVVSLMSTEAVRELRLEPGSLAVAVVKATTVIVETPGGAA